MLPSPAPVHCHRLLGPRPNSCVSCLFLNHLQQTFLPKAACPSRQGHRPFLRIPPNAGLGSLLPCGFLEHQESALCSCCLTVFGFPAEDRLILQPYSTLPDFLHLDMSREVPSWEPREPLSICHTPVHCRELVVWTEVCGLGTCGHTVTASLACCPQGLVHFLTENGG